MNSLLRLLTSSRLVASAIVGFLAWQAWIFLSPRPAPLSDIELLAAHDAGVKLARGFEERIATPARFSIFTLAGDPNGDATQAIRAELASRPKFTVDPESPVKRFAGDTLRAVMDAGSLDEVVHASRKVGIDVVLGGLLAKIHSEENSASVEMRISAFDAREGKWIFRDRIFVGDARRTWFGTVSSRISNTGAFARALVGALFVLVLPWCAWPLIARTAGMKSNTASFLLILALTVLDLIVALALSGFSVHGKWAALLLVLIFAASAGYNFFACESIARRTTD